MVVGRVENGQVQLTVPLPDAWEGRVVKIEPCTPDDPILDLDQRLSALHARGPMEFDEEEAGRE